MRVLTYVHDQSELARIVELMHSKGIPTFSRSAKVGRDGVPRWIIFVCLNSQAKDAETILHFPSHTPKVSVNVDTFERAAYSRNMDVLLRWGLIMLSIVVALFLLALLLTTKD